MVSRWCLTLPSSQEEEEATEATDLAEIDLAETDLAVTGAEETVATVVATVAVVVVIDHKLQAETCESSRKVFTEAESECSVHQVF